MHDSPQHDDSDDFDDGTSDGSNDAMRFGDDLGERFDDDGSSDEGTAWSESLFGFMDQIERGEWPIEIPFAIEFGVKNGRPSILAARHVSQDDVPADDGDTDRPQPPVLRGIHTLDQAKVRRIVLDQLAAAERGGRSKLPGLTLLARVDRDCFLQTAAEHFVALLKETDRKLRSDTLLPEFVSDLHERDGELLVEMVSRTAAVDSIVGRCLREVLLDVISEEPCRDELGLLAVSTLTDRLEDALP
jgi:hypothetical protein